MSDINDGSHHLDGKTKRSLSSVLVKPLQPPFNAPHKIIHFNDENGTLLALSHADEAKVRALLDQKLAGQRIILSAAGDNKHIKISIGGEDE